MEINDKIKIVVSRINLIQEDIQEHNRILVEDTLQEGDEEVIRKSLDDLSRALVALNEHMQILSNSSE